MACFSFLCGRKKTIKHSCDVEEEVSGLHNLELYSYRELRNATENFSLANKIGEGGFGSVYKGNRDVGIAHTGRPSLSCIYGFTSLVKGRLRDGKMAAIKVLSAASRQGVNEFLTEINIISKTEHENLVKLYGCCIEENRRILVYNYLENNSLAHSLIGGGSHTIQFSWKTRCKICVGVARGLAFLHEEVRPHIIHRDIKASNILLDEDLTPKISDFGLAKLLPFDATHVSTRVAGTMGYLAPEYAMRGQITRKTDVYSFGVLLVEIVCGRSNRDKSLAVEEQFLLERTWDLFERKELVSLVDTALNGDFDPEEACKFLMVGLLCTKDNPKLRPSMSTVVKMLLGIIDIDETTITRPALLNDFMDLKAKPGTQNDGKSISSGSYGPDGSTSSMEPTTRNTFSFTAIYDRSL